MKNVLRTAAVGVALASLAIASAASAATDTAPASATILTALSVDNNGTTLNFGSLAESGTGGSITLSPTNSPTCGTGLACGGTTTVPTFTVTGVSGSLVNVSFPTASTTLTGPGTAMTVDSYTASSSQLTLSGGTATFTIGARLAVGSGQVAGVYNGNVAVQVVYN